MTSLVRRSSEAWHGRNRRNVRAVASSTTKRFAIYGRRSARRKCRPVTRRSCERCCSPDRDAKRSRACAAKRSRARHGASLARDTRRKLRIVYRSRGRSENCSAPSGRPGLCSQAATASDHSAALARRRPRSITRSPNYGNEMAGRQCRLGCITISEGPRGP
jgi:hypothetical protein